MKQYLHYLQAINNDYYRIRDWNYDRLAQYLSDVWLYKESPIFLSEEPLLKGSTLKNGMINKNSTALKDFLEANKEYILSRFNGSYNVTTVWEAFMNLYVNDLWSWLNL